MKTCYSTGTLMKQFGNLPTPFLKEPPFQQIPLFLSNFFMTPFFVQILKTRNPPPNFRGEETILLLNKPTYVAMCILDLSSKVLMCNFHYDYFKKI